MLRYRDAFTGRLPPPAEGRGKGTGGRPGIAYAVLALALVDRERDPEVLLHVGHGADVVEVGVGVVDPGRGGAEALQAVGDPVGLVPRVHHDGLPGLLADDDPGVLLEHPDDDLLSDHGGGSVTTARRGGETYGGSRAGAIFAGLR